MTFFKSEVLHNFQEATSREWLETNGIGGFACSTLIGSNTRRYHALLTAAIHSPSLRVVLLSKIEETLIIDGKPYDLSTNQYSGAIHPQGYTYLEEVTIEAFPTFTFSVDGVRILKSLFMVHGQNTVVIQYSASGHADRRVHLELRPLIAFRDYHSLTHENSALESRVSEHHQNLASVQPYQDQPRLYFAHDATQLTSQGCWYRQFEYALERERGLDCVEDLFNPFTLSFDLAVHTHPTVIASLEPLDVSRADSLRKEESDRRSQLTSHLPEHDSLVHTLAKAADQYIVSRGELKTVIAGYPWFTDWGRDTMIALPGLTLVTGRPEIAQNILRGFGRYVDRGMLPNTFPDGDNPPQYNTIDATLWYFEAIRSYLHYTGDYPLIRSELYPLLADIIDWHLRGTRFGIKMDEDGLIESSDATVQLTWMDAKIGDWVVTPRNGKAVEIQALWYNALVTMEAIASELDRPVDAGQYSALAGQAKRSFNELFWNEKAGCLYDCIVNGTTDASMRPNQILAVSLTHSMLSPERAKSIVDAVERELLTPYGLRSLSASDPGYRGRYEGGPFERDSAYHQGTVWAWLIGPFIDAYLKVNGKRKKGVVRNWLNVLATHLNEAGLGHISEIFDGDSPYRPRGCFAQAWSDAEVLRVVMEHGLTAKSEKKSKGVAGAES